MRLHGLTMYAHGIFSPRCMCRSNIGAAYRGGQRLGNQEAAAEGASDERVSTLA